MATPGTPTEREPFVTQDNVGLVGLIIHAGLVVVVTTFVFVLALLGQLHEDAVLGVFGSALGFAGTSAATAQLHRRSTDRRD